MKTMFATALIAAALAVPAAAQEADRSFDGPYVGVQLGLNRDQAGARLDATNLLDRRVSKNSAALGVYGGYNIRVADRIVLAPEAGFSVNLNDSFQGRKAGLAYTLDPKFSFDLGARAGVVAGDNTLIYVRGGYSNVRVGRQETLASGSRLRSNQNFQGWHVGGGVEHALSRNLSARLEYRYGNLDENRGDWRRHQVLAGLGFNF
ncbi:hypothetical protein IP88_03680 [alpha proteobacterium AAP81b]|nr:hypothetical protein IP88_03680 [alpha proteobacterium AAP81b]